MRTIWIACAIACSVPQDAPAPPQLTGGPAPHERSEHTPLPEPEPGTELDPETTCGRALGCCRAFAAATPNVVEEVACAGPLEAAAAPDADERCERMVSGWRVALEHHADGELPAACSAADE